MSPSPAQCLFNIYSTHADTFINVSVLFQIVSQTSKAHEEKLRFSQKKMNEQADKISLLEEEVEKIETNRQRKINICWF